ncbi:DEAD/DEAH box helicase, partial [Clostridium sp. SGI.024]|uniref:DEAD/DEAH box helicase n=1 Tax=Clostridium sp. SGI.024 TaxID=3420551 RepID=UPI003D014779
MICDLESKINKLLSLSKTNELLTYWTKNDILKRINNIESNNIVPSRHSELLAYMYQGSGIKIQNLSEDEAVKFYKKSYDIWKTIWYSNKDKDDIDYIKQLFYLVSTGIISDSLAEVRMILMEIDLDKYLIEQDETEWTKYLEDRVYLIILILLRKKDGWNDIKLVDKIIENIQIAQKSKEDIYLSKLDREDLYDEICWIGSLLNILEAVEYYKKYILTGKPENIEKIITRYCIDSQELLKQANRSDRNFIFILIEKVLKKMVSISLWASVSGISEKIDEYIKLLTDETNNKPIFELWPSQQQAISKNIFDTNKTAIVVQMPTSAGKTLIAKFYILQTLNLYANAKIAYIVPTRALVNQVKRDLRYDFGRIGINVDISIPYNDIEGMEDQLLLKDTDIIITTPEKLDILVKSKHPFVEQLKLLVVDEAHGLQEYDRGAKLELLLAMLRKEHRNLRILMLSPFMKNADNISQWLSGDRGHEVFVDWKPSQQFTGSYTLDKIKRNGRYTGEITYIPSSLNTMYSSEFKVRINDSKRKNITKTEQSIYIAEKYEKLGGVLILCVKKIIAEGLIKKFLYRDVLKKEKLDELKFLLDLVEKEMGKECLLYESIRRGCAYHHSSLPLIIREEIEEAISKQLITIVAATTTLAQGMNFPISTVIFQGVNIPSSGYSRKMTTSEFWNIAGRAGRALVDKEGHIIVICNNDSDKEDFEKYLRYKNQEVISSLLNMLENVPEDGINKYWIRQHKELSALLQYIHHILLIDPNIEIDDLLRGSLVYHQLEANNDRELGEKLLRLTQNYIYKLDNELKRKKLMESIDKTGLSSISMNMLLIKLGRETIEIDDKILFDYNDTKLERLIDIINEIPEINLSLYNSQGFSAKLVASITKDWVNGKTLREIASNIDIGKSSELDEKINVCGEYIYSKLINNLPWGMSAVQRASSIVRGKEGHYNNILVPSYIYFGVSTEEAVAFCMLGVPRFAAEEMGEYWRRHNGKINIEKVSLLKVWMKSLN